MFGHPDTFPLTFHVLRLRDSGAQTQGEGEEKQSHLFSLSVNSFHFQGYGDGVKEKQKQKYRGAMEKKSSSLRARSPGCRMCPWLAVWCTSYVIKSPLCVMKSAERRLDPGACTCVSVSVSVCV